MLLRQRFVPADGILEHGRIKSPNFHSCRTNGRKLVLFSFRGPLFFLLFLLFFWPAATQKLPWQLQARAEFEYVGAKPLDTGCNPNPAAECTGVRVKEFRAAVVRRFLDGRVDVGANMLVAGGYTGQTTETFGSPMISEVVEVRIPSYASLSLTYRFGP